jgi:MinD superfamily P-loop ATPase
MRIAIASGKGGTGKTTIATDLAWVAARHGRSVAYLDCDVEAPNGHLFLKPEIASSRPIGRLYPAVDEEKCSHCGLCGEICQYSAIVCVGGKVLVYPELCHACGGCVLVCGPGAIREAPRESGRLEVGHAGPIQFIRGVLRIGEAMSTHLIHQVKQASPETDLVIMDSPPGTSCPVIESVRGADLVLLVTEPTPFGVNDLKLAVEMVRALGLPLGVVINRAGSGDGHAAEYCRTEGIDVLAVIPDDRRVAEAYSRGILAAEALPEIRASIEQLLARVLGEAAVLPPSVLAEARL